MIKSKRIRWAGHVASTRQKRMAYKVLVGKKEGKRLRGRSRRKWEDNIKIDLKEIEWGTVDWINLAEDKDQWRALVNTVIYLWVP
jgi:hypothetical protein